MNPRSLRIVFFGSPRFAVPTLDRLLASRHAVVAVVTQPDRPRGRGQHVTEGPVKALATSRGIAVLQPDRLKTAEFLDAFRQVRADLGVVAAYGKILPDDVLRMPPLGLVNVHASLLPRWRGAAPVERAVMAGDSRTGVTIMRVVRALDSGPTFAAAERPIGDDETAETIEADLSELGADLLIPVIDDLAAGRAVETLQDDAAATYAARLTKDEGLIDWNEPARAIHNKVRGLQPWPHAHTFFRGARYIVLRTAVGERHEEAPPGTAIEAAGDRLVIAAGDGRSVRIERIQAEGRRPATAREFLAGHRLDAGARFGTAGAP